MTYASQETSVYSGNPIELYLFDRESIAFWGYTSADTDQTYASQTYEAIPISRSKIELSQDITRASLSIELPANTDFLEQYISAPPTDIITLTIRRFHEGDPEVVSIWTGRITNIGFNGYTAEVYCESIHTAIRRPSGRRLYQVNCHHALYGSKCGVVQSTHKTTATLSAIDGLVITSSTFGLEVDGFFSGGIIDYTSDGLITRRFATNHVGDDITLNLPLTGAYVGAPVDAYPGCNRTTTHCNDKFSNLPNYGGQPFYPGKNPFLTTMVF